MEESVNTDKQRKEQIKAWRWKPGQSGNPAGRPKGKSMKEYSKEYLASMPEEERIEFLKSIDPEAIWKMAEGLPKTTITGDADNPVAIKVINYDNTLPIQPKTIPDTATDEQDKV